jgi:hypothetical protein
MGIRRLEVGVVLVTIALMALGAWALRPRAEVLEEVHSPAQLIAYGLADAARMYMQGSEIDRAQARTARSGQGPWAIGPSDVASGSVSDARPVAVDGGGVALQIGERRIRADFEPSAWTYESIGLDGRLCLHGPPHDFVQIGQARFVHARVKLEGHCGGGYFEWPRPVAGVLPARGRLLVVEETRATVATLTASGWTSRDAWLARPEDAVSLVVVVAHQACLVRPSGFVWLDDRGRLLRAVPFPNHAEDVAFSHGLLFLRQAGRVQCVSPWTGKALALGP